MSLKRKRNIKLVALLGLTAVLLITTGWSVMADIEPMPMFVPGGTYVEVRAGLYSCQIVIPNDPAANTTTHIGYLGINDPTISGWFPEADYRYNLVGNGVRVGPYTWHVSGIQYGSKKGGRLQYILLFSTEVTFSEDGETMDMDGTFETYLPEQDADKDGFPDEGEVTSSWARFTTTFKRVPIRPLYEPSP